MNKLFIYLAVLATVWLSPFIILSIFNQPSSDDFLYTAWTINYGFLETQHRMFVTYNGRYFSTAFMSLNSWVYGSTVSFKILPPLTIVAWVGALYNISTLIFGNSLAKWQRLSLGLFLTSVYYACMSGIYEGCYWMSGVACYQYPLVAFVFIFPWARRISKNDSLIKKCLLFCAVLGAAGCHEMIALMAAIISLFLVVANYKREKSILTGYTIITLAAGLSILVQLLSIGNRGKANVKLDTRDWGVIKCFTTAILQTCYHILSRCLLSPCFWLAALAVFLIVCKHYRHILKLKPVVSQKYIPACVALSVFMIFFPGILLVYIEGTYAPMRALNISIFMFIASFFILVVLSAVYIAQHAIWQTIMIDFMRKKNWLLIPLVLLVFIFPGNMKTVTADILSGAAYKFDNEIEGRFAAIKECKSSVCPFACLINMPPVLCPSDAARDSLFTSYHEMIFSKKLVVDKACR